MEKKIQGRTNVSETKKKEIAELTENLDNYNSFLISSIDEMPALLFQKTRKEVKDKAIVKAVKRRVLVKLFEEYSAKHEKYSKIADFCRNLKDSCVIIFSNEDIFSLSKVFREKQEQKKAKAGKSKEEISIKAGPTGLPAGPILAELSDAGIKAGLEKGKVVIRDSFMIKKGDTITESLAKALEKLNILPVTARLFPLLAYDKKSDILFKSEDLEVNVEQQLAKLKEAYNNAFALILESKYFTKESSTIFLKEAYNNAFYLSKDARIITKENVKDFIIEANNQASLINNKI
ncbi:MAG: 50S ribosomal protein L10 [Nanoarchaeota archaeon]|nr:50S ribosomal protein L10 [Nanoarchaeota archaeon]